MHLAAMYDIRVAYLKGTSFMREKKLNMKQSPPDLRTGIFIAYLTETDMIIWHKYAYEFSNIVQVLIFKCDALILVYENFRSIISH